MPITLGTDGYAVAADVQAINQQRTYTTTTKPTLAQVIDFITDSFWEINGLLDAQGYTVPVATTATKASLILQRINALGGAVLAEEAAYSVGMGNENARTVSMREQYEKRLDLLRKGEVSLIDAARGTDSPNIVNEKTPAGSFNLDSSGVERAPSFTRTMDL